MKNNVFLAVLLASFLCSAQPTAAGPALLRNGDVIEFFRDSITWQGGYVDMMRQALEANPAAKGLAVKLIKRGINGGTSTDLRDGCWDLYGCTQAPFTKVLAQDAATVAVIYIGINDVWHGAKGNPPAVYEAALRRLVQSAKERNVAVILATPTVIGELPRGKNPLDKQLDQYAEIAKGVGRETKTVVVDLRTAFFDALDRHFRDGSRRADKGILTYDGVHMTDAGNRIIADLLEKGVESALHQGPKSARRDQSLLGSLKLVPWPNKVELHGGALALKPSARIAVAGPRLAPLAHALAGEIELAGGLRLKATNGRSKPGDIALTIDKTQAGETYRIDVGDRVVVRGGDYSAVAQGTITLLQALASAGRARLPKMTIEDCPAAGYRGLMIDVARRYHSIDCLRQCVELCRLYKIRFLQLHLTDDQAFTFPSRAFPLLAASSHNGGPAYTIAELEDLVRFAEERGVAIVPELEVPGHAATMVRTYPDLFKIKGTKPYEHHATVNFANDAVLEALDTIVGEICGVFTSTPYFHIGGDEADFVFADQHPDFKAKFKQFGLGEKGQWELYRRFLCEMDEMVKRHGKKTLVWEGFGRDPNSKFPIPKDVTVMEFESAYYLPEDLTADGYTLVNAAWTPLYLVNRHVWKPEEVYAWDPTLFGRYSTLLATTEWHRVKDPSRIAGAQVCCWEQPEAIEIQNVRKVLPAMAERVWNPLLGRPFEDFDSRLASTDALAERLLHTVRFDATGLVPPSEHGFDCRSFGDPMTLIMATDSPGLDVRYTLDGTAPTKDSLPYHGPIEIKATTTVRAAAFNASGKRVGWETGDVYYFGAKPEPNLATGKPVTVSGGTQGPQAPELAVDGNLDLGSSWWAAPAPQWLRVDLQSEYSVNRIKVYPYWDGSRYYRYTVEASVDGSNWTLVGDKSRNTVPASPEGDEFKLPAAKVRYVRVNMLKCSANEGVHLVELQVFEAK